MALRDDVLLKKIQLMSRIDAQCEFEFFNRLIICATLAEMEKSAISLINGNIDRKYL